MKKYVHRRLVWMMCITVLTVLTGCRKGEDDLMINEEKQPGFQQIAMQEGLERMEADTDFVLLDVRRAEEFAAGHIPGAINIPNESIGTEDIKELPDKNQTIYVYCRSGNRSKQAARKLAELGYTNIIEFGGIMDYSGEVESQ